MLFFFVLVFLGFFVLLFYNVHYLILLLSVEVILLGLVFFMCVGWLGGSLLGAFFFLLLMACMGGFSVSLLVSLFRGLGRDFWFGSGLF